MPTGLVRFHDTRNFHFVTFSCFGRRPYFREPEACDLFEDALERTRIRYGFYLCGYVVMPEHIHMLLSEPERGGVADVMKALKLSVALRRPERPFWLARYHDFNVFTETKRKEKLKYLHRNLVTRGLVEKPEDWEWSSFNHYATGITRRVEVESPWTASRRERADS